MTITWYMLTILALIGFVLLAIVTTGSVRFVWIVLAIYQGLDLYTGPSWARRR